MKSLSESSREGCSESSEASFSSASEDFQLYDVSAEPIATEKEATSTLNKLYNCRGRRRVRGHDSSRFADDTDLPDWYFFFGFFLSILSVCFYQCVYFRKQKAKIPSSLFRRKLCWIGSVTVFQNLCLVDIERLKFLYVGQLPKMKKKRSKWYF